MTMKAIKTTDAPKTYITGQIQGNWGSSKPRTTDKGSTVQTTFIGWVELMEDDSEQGIICPANVTTWKNPGKGDNQSLEIIRALGAEAVKNAKAHKAGKLERVAELRAAKFDYIQENDSEGTPQYQKLTDEEFLFMYGPEGEALASKKNALKVLGAAISAGEVVRVMSTAGAELEELEDLI